MDLDALNTHLSELANNYDRSRRAGHAFAGQIAASTAALLPAVGVVQKFSQAMFGHADAERHAVLGLKGQIEDLKLEEKRHLLRQVELERIAAERQQMINRHRSLVLERERLESIRTPDEFESKRLKKLTEKLIPKTVKSLNRSGREMEAADQDLENSVARQAKMRLELHKSAEEVLSVTRALAGAGGIFRGAVAASGISYAAAQSFAFNRSLIEANSGLAQRRALLSGALETQLRTGDSMENIVELMKELRSQTQLNQPGWVDLAETASKLHQGLGASNTEIGAMLNASRALKLSFRDLADSVTNIVDKTSLSVRETVALVTELRRVLVGFNAAPVGASLDGPLRHLAALEQAMKERGATEGAALRALAPFAKMNQAGGLGMMFGSGGPDFLRDPQRTAQMTQRMADYLRQFRNAPLVFEQIAESLHMSADEAQIFIDAAGAARRVESELGEKRIDLDKRFAEQSAASGRIYGQLFNNLKALLLEGLSPVTYAVGYLNRVLVKLREGLEITRGMIPDWAKAGAKITVTGAAMAAVGFAAYRATVSLLLLRNALVAIAAQSAISRVAGSKNFIGPLLPTVTQRATQTLSRVAPAVVASAKGVVTATRNAAAAATAAPTAATGAVAFIRGLLPAIMASLPILLPVVLGAAAAWWFVHNLRSGAEAMEKKNLIEMEMMRRTRTVGEVRESAARFARQALDVKDGVEAARRLRAGIPSQRQAILDAWRKGDFSVDAKVFSKAIEEAQRRVEVQRATIQREAQTAPAAVRDQMYEGLLQLIQAVRKLEDTQYDLAAKQARLFEEARLRDQAIAEREKSEASVRSVTARGLEMVPGPSGRLRYQFESARPD